MLQPLIAQFLEYCELANFSARSIQAMEIRLRELKFFSMDTNNILERFFRLLRRHHRRKTGNNSMRRSLQAMLADTPLIQNLKNSSYMEILLNGTSTLEELFASLETTADTNSMLREDRAGTDRILPGCRSLIRMETLPAQVASALMAA